MIIIEKNIDFNGFSPYQNYPPYDMGFDPTSQDPLINPLMQYEQAYMYYRYLTQQLEYKIKCKEYEKICKNEHKLERRVE